MEERTLQDLSEVIQSSNINFLFGAGVSTPFLPLLDNIEKLLNEAQDGIEREKQYKEYFNKVMLPNKKVIDNSVSTQEYEQTKKSYDDFFLALSEVILQRKNTILSKQVNLFTTNIDVLMETALERLLIEYNDGFSGKLNPTFSSSHFKKSIQQRSLHFDHVSEIPVFNIIKIHGSLTWQQSDDKITFSHSLNHIEESILNKTGSDFLEIYKKILVVNPEASKHLESVLNLYYYELLRMYSSELEKENATLFIVGFSMGDEHIKEITLRAAKANPTLRIFVCCSKSSKKNMETKLETIQHLNIQVLTPDTETEKFTLDCFTSQILHKIVGKKSNSDAEQTE
jgi:NAD-dependent SIR2 family protein deacetylase